VRLLFVLKEEIEVGLPRVIQPGENVRRVLVHAGFVRHAPENVLDFRVRK
jgi:hypothetical protein